MGAEGARVTYPYLSGQWTEQEQYDDTFLSWVYLIYRCTNANDYTNLFLQPEYIYICSGFSIYLPNMREKCIKRKR